MRWWSVCSYSSCTTTDSFMFTICKNNIYITSWKVHHFVSHRAIGFANVNIPQILPNPFVTLYFDLTNRWKNQKNRTTLFEHLSHSKRVILKLTSFSLWLHVYVHCVFHIALWWSHLLCSEI
jgi:hypothetical protein